MAVPAADKVVDARGSFCPGPLMELIKAIRDEPVGAVIDVLSSDLGSTKDIPAWVEKAGHELLEIKEDQGYWHVLVRKLK